MIKRICILLWALICVCLASCANAANKIENKINIQISGVGLNVAMNENDLKALEHQQYVYSSINNWPADKVYATKGVTISSLLEKLQKQPKALIFEAEDGYQIAITYEQLFKDRYSYIGDEATQVEPILAYEFAQSDDISQAKPCGLMLIFGQTNPNEHTNPAFVENISKVTLLDDIEKWEAPTCFPPAGKIEKGEGVKLLHESLGLLKIYYTTDGSVPDESSAMYNPSTYQPNLNKPIPITENTVIRAIAIGYGKLDSDIAEFTFEVKK